MVEPDPWLSGLIFQIFRFKYTYVYIYLKYVMVYKVMDLARI